MSNRAEAVTKDDVQTAIKVSRDDELSIRNLIAKQDYGKRISDPREYQIELFERAKEQNTIAVLDTGREDLPPTNMY